MEVDITLNLPEPVNKLLNPIAESAGKTLSNVWEGCFAGLNTWSKKVILKHEQDFIAYKESVEREVSAIPESNRKEPRLSIIGPAIESSKYYIEEPIIREMFAKLIAADMDFRKNGLVHHAFVDIVRQMAPNDAQLLKALPKNGPIAEIRLYDKEHTAYIPLTSKDVIYIPGLIESNFSANAISINNLARLGIVELDHVMSLTNASHYNAYKRLDEYELGLKEVQANSEKYSSVEIDKGMFSITALGTAFRQICL